MTQGEIGAVEKAEKARNWLRGDVLTAMGDEVGEAAVERRSKVRGQSMRVVVMTCLERSILSLV